MEYEIKKKKGESESKAEKYYVKDRDDETYFFSSKDNAQIFAAILELRDKTIKFSGI